MDRETDKIVKNKIHSRFKGKYEVSIHRFSLLLDLSYISNFVIHIIFKINDPYILDRSYRW